MNSYPHKCGRLLPLLFFCCCCCACTVQPERQEIRPQAQEPLMHAIYSDQLKSIMTRMEQLVFERELTALQIEEMRADSLENLISTVTELVLTARNMQGSSPGTALNAADKVTFEALANQLLATAEQLQSRARNSDLAGLDITFERLNETCNACHRLFRR